MTGTAQEQNDFTESRFPCCAIQVDGFYYPLIQMGIHVTPISGKPDFVTQLTGFLHYRSKTLPPIEVFETRDWLRLYFGSWEGGHLLLGLVKDTEFERKHLIQVGSTLPRADDPVASVKAGGQWPYVEGVLGRLSSLPDLGP